MEARSLKGFHVALGDHGHTMRMILTFSDDSQENVDFPPHLAPRIVQALIQVAQAGEVARKTQPGGVFSTESPWFATNARAGIGEDGKIVIQFQTTQGPPILIAMDRSLAETTIGCVKAELGRPPPRKVGH